MVSGKAELITIPKKFWSYPDFIDKKKASSERAKLVNRKVQYDGSESYRFMCRFDSGFI